MKYKLLLVVIGLIFCNIAVLLSQTSGVIAVDALTDNTTMPDFLNSDESHEAIKPPQDCILLGLTSQTENYKPKVILSFSGASEQDNVQITADNLWYLEIDINAPGWLYLYEYFPPGSTVAGEWIAYKWEFIESGHWKLGPFSPRENELEGLHTYRIWFFSNGQWADENSNAAQDNLVAWTYSKYELNSPTTQQQMPQLTISPLKESTSVDNLRNFFNQPIVMVLLLSILIFIAILGSYLLWTRIIKARLNYRPQAEPEEPSNALSSDLNQAKILLPNGLEIKLGDDTRIIGRGDFTRIVELNQLVLISRQHFQVTTTERHFYIEDLNSTNGTRLNGEDIKGKGTVSLNDNDIIEPAGTTRLKFNLLCIPQNALE